MVTLEDLKQNNQAPRSTELIDLNDSRLVSIEEFRKLYSEGKSDGKLPLPNNCKWVAYDENKKLCFACTSDDKITRYQAGKSSLRYTEFRGGKLHITDFLNFRNEEKEEEKGKDFGMADFAGFATRARQTAKTEKLDKDVIVPDMELNKLNKNNDNKTRDKMEDIKMNNDMNFNFDELASEFGNTDFGVETTETTKMNLGGETTPAVNTAATGIEDTVDADAPWLYEIGKFNQNEGSLLGYITNNDAKINITAKKIASNKKSGAGKDTAGQSALDQNAAGDTNSKMISISQSAPGKILGGVLEMPAGGIFDLTSLQTGTDANGKEVKPDWDNKAKKIMLLENEQLTNMIALGFNSEVPESKKTFGPQAGITSALIKPVKRKVEGSDEVVTVSELYLKSSRKGSKLAPDAYLPLNTFQTIDALRTDLTQEEVDTLNESSFFQLFQTNAKRPTAAYKQLTADYAKRVKLNAETGKYESDYFTLDLAKRLDLDIKPWYVKASEKHEKLDKVPVIVKVPTPTKDGESMRLVVQRINVLRDQDKPLYNELNSLSDPRFEKFVEACNGVLTVENLNKVFGRKSVSKKAAEKLATSSKNLMTLRSIVAGSKNLKKMDTLFNELKRS